MHYDIVYSITAHESIECVDNLYENIMKFHPNINCLIIFNINNFLMTQKAKIQYRDNLLFQTSEKNRFDSTIFQAHIDNYNYVKNYDFDYFGLLASNCMFCKNTNIDLINNSSLSMLDEPYKCKIHEWNINNGLCVDVCKTWFATFRPIEHDNIINMFSKYEIEPIAAHHEGTYYKKEVISWISNFCQQKNINKSILYDGAPWEELVLPSLEKYITGSVSHRYREYGTKDNNYITNEKEIEELIINNAPNNIIKPVDRDMNNPLRKFINKL